jgi:hypothetical protein
MGKRTIKPETMRDRVLKEMERAGRSTPMVIGDCQHMWDSRGKLWCYSEPGDVWWMRQDGTEASLLAPYSARSWARLNNEFGPMSMTRPHA